MTSPFLYGMERSNHDFHSPDSLGKNIFTNAFPLSLMQYAHLKKGLSVPVIRAEARDESTVTTAIEHALWSEIIGADPAKAEFSFETVFSGYNQYTHNGANKSDVVVRSNGNDTRPLEIKLVVVPTSATAHKTRDKQSCEIVTRPSTVEQIAFSIAHSLGSDRRLELLDIINAALGHPHDYEWGSATFMAEKISNFQQAATDIIRAGIDVQTPLVLTAVWRTKGQSPELDDNAFDAFVWTDLAFAQLYLDAAGPSRGKSPVSRPSRSLMWLVSCLYEFAAQGTMNFDKTRSTMNFGYQGDKAGAFAGAAPLEHMQSPEFLHPRISRFAVEEILSPKALGELLPERRLDQAIALQHLTNLAEMRGASSVQSTLTVTAMHANAKGIER